MQLMLHKENKMSKNRFACAITDNNVTVCFSGQTHIVPRTEALADRLIKAIKEGRTDDIPNLITETKRKIVAYGKGDFTIQDGLIMVNGQPVHEVLGRKILKFQSEGLPHKPLVRFAENLQKNPSFRAVNELFTFLEKNDHPITEDGKFIAYKKVRKDYKDIYSGRFDNHPGETPNMPRNQVNEDSSQTCSEGLHVANWDYAYNHYGSRDDIMLEVEVNPADVVSIPIDYNNAKMRVCEYKVLCVVDKEHSSDDRLRTSSCPDYVFHNAPEEEEELCCQAGFCACAEDCGCDCDDDVCSRCEFDMENTCDHCGCETDIGFDLCLDCEGKEDDSAYPFEDELG
jgi:hypothetical protein